MFLINIQFILLQDAFWKEQNSYLVFGAHVLSCDIARQVEKGSKYSSKKCLYGLQKTLSQGGGISFPFFGIRGMISGL